MMRRHILLVVSAGAFTCFAVAADATPRKPRVALKAPPPVVTSAPSFYAGVHLGYGAGRFSSPGSAETLNTSGVLGGWQIGTNVQYDKSVFGIEADFSLSDVKGSVTGDLGGTPITGTARHLWFATLAGRAGFASGLVLAYFKAGGAWTSYKWNFDAPAVGSAFATFTRAGWMLGAGVEHAFTDRLSAKVEYNYMDFGTKTETLSTTGGLGAAPADVRLYVHAVKLGLNYRFNAPAGWR